MNSYRSLSDEFYRLLDSAEEILHVLTNSATQLRKSLKFVAAL